MWYLNLKDGTIRIGDTIRTTREAKGLTLSELARRLKTHPSNVQRWEINRVSPTYDTLQRIADALRVPPSELVGDYEDEQMDLLQESPAPVGRRWVIRCACQQRCPTSLLIRRLQCSLKLANRNRRPPTTRRSDATASLPADLTTNEIRQLAAMILAFLANRPPKRRRGRPPGRSSES